MRFLCAAIDKDDIKVIGELGEQRCLAEMGGVADIATHSLAPDLHDLRHDRGVLLEHQLCLKLRKCTKRRTGIVDDIHHAHFRWAAPKRAGIASLSVYEYLPSKAYVTFRG